MGKRKQYRENEKFIQEFVRSQIRSDPVSDEFFAKLVKRHRELEKLRKK